MDCNKDEALKAKEIAEKKMEVKDFVGAKKIALRAQRLYSELDGILQLLTVCDVHCSAEEKVLGTEKNWYGILQVEVTADEALIKKQYRRLALLLHPDKNKLAGAEAAFKLIGEAHRVLSDKLSRSKYDMLYKAFKERLAHPQQRQNSTLPVRKQSGVGSNFSTQFTSVNLRGIPVQPGLERPTFWTACPFCSMKYQYYRDVLNRAIRCQNCLKPFIAYDLNVQGVPSGANLSRPAVPQPAVPQPSGVSQAAHKRGPQNTARDFASKVGISKVNTGSKSSAKVDGGVNGAAKKRPRFDAEMHAAGREKRKSEVESSESCDTESSNDELGVTGGENGSVHVKQNSGIPEGRNARRSSRQKRQVIYNEDSDDDRVGHSRRNKTSNGEASTKDDAPNVKSGAFGTDVKVDEELKKQKRSVPVEESSRNGNVQDELYERNGKKAAGIVDDTEESDSDESIQANSDYKTKPDPEFIEVADPEFYQFDEDRKEECVKDDQMWAVYDNTDGMPRFYARIRKVLSPGFKVRITWLEPNPDNEDEIDWVNEDLPVSCGKFKTGKTEITEDINMFSHLASYSQSGRRGSVVVIYPRKGEVWALFKNWSIRWNSDPDNHRIFEFDFVEILSDYNDKSGSTVAYLEKVKGFVSLFRQKKGVDAFQILESELYRISHMIPSKMMTGKERNDVPEGYFELDPASLPANFVGFKDV